LLLKERAWRMVGLALFSVPSVFYRFAPHRLEILFP